MFSPPSLHGFPLLTFLFLQSHRKRPRALTKLKDGLEVLRVELRNALAGWREEDVRRGGGQQHATGTVFGRNAKGQF